MNPMSGYIPRLDRWLALSAAMIMMGCAGLTYTYAVYSEHMKLKLRFSQEQVDDIGAAKDFGGVLGLISGVLYSLYPPWVTIGIGAALHLYGYTMVWMTLAGRVTPSFWLLSMYIAVGTGGDAWIDTACMMTSLQNYEEDRGTAMGILKAQLGLSGAIFVMIYEVLLEPEVEKFLLLMSLAPTLLWVSLAYFVRPFTGTNDEHHSSPHRLKSIFIAIIILGSYMMFTMTCEHYFHVVKAFQKFSVSLMLAIMIVMYTIPLVRVHSSDNIDLAEGVELSKLPKKTSDLAETPEENSQLLKPENGDDVSENKSSSYAPNHIHSITFMESVVDFNFWLIFLVVTIGAGTGVAIINNFAQIGEALRAGGTDMYVGFISIWSCFGRLGSGYVSDYLMRLGYPRTLCLLITQITMGLCCLLLATGLLPSLFFGSILIGFSYGAYWTLVPAILSEVFGVQNFTVLYKLVSLGPPVSSYLLSAKVMGYLYDEQAKLYSHQHSLATDTNSCYGSKCFGSGLLVLSFVSLIGACASFVLLLGTRTIYKNTKPSK